MRAAVIGLGRMGAFTSETVTKYAPSCWFPLSHAQAIQDHPDLELLALCDINEESIKKASEKYTVKKTYTDFHKLLLEIRPDLIGIATRTIGRCELIEIAAAEGVRAVHTEKPLCNDLNELDRLSKLFSHDDLHVTWGAIRRFSGIYQHALALAKSGRFGGLREVRVNFGRAPLFWTHPHAIDLILFAAAGSNVTQVQARLLDVDNDKSVTLIENDPFVVNASVFFENGLVGIINQSLGSDFILSCERAEISVVADGSHIEIYEKVNGPYAIRSIIEYHGDRQYSGTLEPVSQLVRCLKGDAAAIDENNFLKKDILLAQYILFAIVQSHLEDGKPISLREIDNSLRVLGATNGRPA